MPDRIGMSPELYSVSDLSYLSYTAYFPPRSLALGADFIKNEYIPFLPAGQRGGNDTS